MSCAEREGDSLEWSLQNWVGEEHFAQREAVRWAFSGRRTSGSRGECWAAEGLSGEAESSLVGAEAGEEKWEAGPSRGGSCPAWRGGSQATSSILLLSQWGVISAPALAWGVCPWAPCAWAWMGGVSSVGSACRVLLSDLPVAPSQDRASPRSPLPGAS